MEHALYRIYRVSWWLVITTSPSRPENMRFRLLGRSNSVVTTETERNKVRIVQYVNRVRNTVHTIKVVTGDREGSLASVLSRLKTNL